MRFVKQHILLALFLGLGFIFPLIAVAGSEHNIYGWAWSENIGWISFNSFNCDADYNGSSDGTAGCPLAGTLVPNYGVNVNKETGIFNGYAWAESVGWITFNETELINCPSGGGVPDPTPCQAFTNFDVDPRQILGWARACSVFQSNCSGLLNPNRGNWDGWIRLKDTNYSIWVDTDVTPTEFKNWAWADNFDVIGWISFNKSNCENNSKCTCSSKGGAGCPNATYPCNNACAVLRDYKVLTKNNFNRSPSARNLSAPPNRPGYCIFYYPPISLYWEFFDPDDEDIQLAYQVQIDSHGATFPSIEIDSKKVLLPSGSYSPGNRLLFDTTYNWRVMVWDNSSIIGDPSVWAVGPPFTTEPHNWPKPQFSFTPLSPAVGELVNFIDSSKCYDADNNWYLCNTDSGSHYVWDFGEGDKNCKTGKNNKGEYVCSQCDSKFEATCRGDVIHVYSIMGDFEPTLTITDVDDFGPCKSPTVIISPTPPLPEWKEIPPTASIFNFFSRINGFVDFHFF